MLRKIIENRMTEKVVLEEPKISRRKRKLCSTSIKLLSRDALSTQGLRSTNLVSGAAAETTCSSR